MVNSDRATSNSGFCLLRGAEMLNIRKRSAMLFVGLVFLGTCPPISAAEAPVVEQEIKEPLEGLRSAKELTEYNLISVLKAVGFEGKALKTAWAVAMKESNGRPRAHNDNVNTGDNSYGIFQINMLGSLGEDRREKFNLESNKDLFDPIKNAEIAYHMSNGGEDWSAWKVYPNQVNGERYESFLKKFPLENKK